MKPFRFGINARDAGSRAGWQDKARRVEDLGYSVLMVPDHLAAMLAPIPAAVSAAAATKSLRVGTNVLNNDFRHPVLVAREMATVDLLTEGRLQLGLGAGYMHAEYEEAGFRFEAGGRRVELSRFPRPAGLSAQAAQEQRDQASPAEALPQGEPGAGGVRELPGHPQRRLRRSDLSADRMWPRKFGLYTAVPPSRSRLVIASGPRRHLAC